MPGRPGRRWGPLVPTGEISLLTFNDLEEVSRRIPFPRGTVLALPDMTARMTDNFAPFIPISLEALEAGFRLPLSGLGVSLCWHLSVTPGQLSPESWRFITAHVDRKSVV